MSISGVNIIICPYTLINQMQCLSVRVTIVNFYNLIPYHDSVIKSCSTAKLLGVTVNNSLSWNNHIETVIKYAIHISILYHESNYISQLTIVNAFITHIFSLILIYVVLSGEIAHITWRKN